MPAYRAHSHIARAVKSVQAQSLDSWELVIASDDQSDYLAHLAQHHIRDSRIRMISTGKYGSGIGAARNAALRAAKADYIAVLDADDVFHPEKLSAMLPYARRYALCSCALENIHYQQEKPIQLALTGGVYEGELQADNYLNINFSSHVMLVFDRTRVPLHWREDVEALEDLLFAMAAYDYVPESYHLKFPYHQYVYSPSAMSAQTGAAELFLRQKKILLNALQAPAYGVFDARSRQAIQRFLNISIIAEEHYARAQKHAKNISFTQIFSQLLSAQAA